MNKNDIENYAMYALISIVMLLFTGYYFYHKGMVSAVKYNDTTSRYSFNCENIVKNFPLEVEEFSFRQEGDSYVCRLHLVRPNDYDMQKHGPLSFALFNEELSAVNRYVEAIEYLKKKKEEK